MKRRFAGGCTGYVHPTTRGARPMGGCAGWMHSW